MRDIKVRRTRFLFHFLLSSAQDGDEGSRSSVAAQFGTEDPDHYRCKVTAGVLMERESWLMA
ncbi:hypothetical protein EXN66_Car013319 [Channa argus]|uniref:Uncharacterized protein n=1 Tax=Channa argus TaxID=215402 RepID=A0A6G1Q5C0_CHAAH|nr:hypothetical protein EXN66_Car013319 [Channa argus]